MKKYVCLAGLLSIASLVQAAAPVALETPVSYAAGASVVDSVRSECQIEDMLARRIGPVMSKLGTASGTVDVAADQSGMQVLRLKITHVLGVGGGAWSGPKAITVNAQLLENGKLVRETRVNRWSVGGVFGGFRGTCSILDRCAVAISKDLYRWVKDPNFQIKEEPAPKEASAAAAG